MVSLDSMHHSFLLLLWNSKHGCKKGKWSNLIVGSQYRPNISNCKSIWNLKYSIRHFLVKLKWNILDFNLKFKLKWKHFGFQFEIQIEMKTFWISIWNSNWNENILDFNLKFKLKWKHFGFQFEIQIELKTIWVWIFQSKFILLTIFNIVQMLMY